MVFEIFYIVGVIPIMVVVQKIRGQIKPRVKAWLIAKAQTRPHLASWLKDPFASLYVKVFTNSMFVSAFIFAELLTLLGLIPTSPPEWVQLYAITFATIAFGAIFPIVSDAREGKGIFADLDKPKEREKRVG